MRMRRSLLFMPGNNPAMLLAGNLFEADGVILDLEDAVAPTEKDAARILVAQALKTIDYGTCEKVVRVNPLDTYGLEDIPFIAKCAPDTLLIPKVESGADIKKVTELLDGHGAVANNIKLIALLETPRGIANAYEIAGASSRLVALALGAEDYTAFLGAKRTKSGEEIFAARMAIVNAAAAFSLQSIDTPFTDAADDEGLVEDTRLAKALGFKGKLSINPRQIEGIHAVFNPTLEDINWARKVVNALEQAKNAGLGVASLGGKMIDAPVANRANIVLDLALRAGLISKEDL